MLESLDVVCSLSSLTDTQHYLLTLEEYKCASSTCNLFFAHALVSTDAGRSQGAKLSWLVVCFARWIVTLLRCLRAGCSAENSGILVASRKSFEMHSSRIEH
jgi:hypothetical protein